MALVLIPTPLGSETLSISNSGVVFVGLSGSSVPIANQFSLLHSSTSDINISAIGPQSGSGRAINYAPRASTNSTKAFRIIITITVAVALTAMVVLIRRGPREGEQRNIESEENLVVNGLLLHADQNARAD